MHTFISWAFCFGFPRISKPSTFPLAVSVIMVELAAWPYLSCHVHSFAPRFNVAMWAKALYWSIEVKHNSSIMSVSIQTCSFVNIMELLDMSVSQPYSMLTRVNDSNPLRRWGTCNTSCMIAKLSYLSDNLTFPHPATFNIEISISIIFFELLMTRW